MGGFLLAVAALLAPAYAPAAIDGLVGNSFTLDAAPGFITSSDFNRIFIWGFADGDTGTVQFPGPTLFVNQGDNVTVTLRNNLPESTSIVFPGMANVTASAGVRGPIAAEAAPGKSITYAFTASRPGTFTYYSGTNIDRQVEMGLFGTIIVRPTGYNPLDNTTWRAYTDNGSKYDREFLYVLSDMDDQVHVAAQAGMDYDSTIVLPVYWFCNGRGFPDTMADGVVPDLPSQPYNCLPRMHPGDRILLRFVGGVRDSHPLHTHGNNANIIARNASYYSTGVVVDNMADLAESSYTITVSPGQTTDAIFEWTGAQVGFDVYGHTPFDNVACNGATSGPGVGFDNVTREYCPDHTKPFPAPILSIQDVANGPFYSGSPFLGSTLPVAPGTNPGAQFGSYFFMSHSHNEREITTNNVFPGGMATMVEILPYGVPLEETPAMPKP
jgi:FtsP/CotA-like multicopper oxidase with cupredoxin domain